MDNTDEIKIILHYINDHRANNSELSTLWHEIGQEKFLEAIREADGRRIILYHAPADKDKDDPPLYFRYEKKWGPQPRLRFDRTYSLFFLTSLK